ncbi:lipase family protein [Nocardia noduli]|uniref:lipase family protein n=1 Tax=Nocardia noduli TaxID=2815722 RepID=UPI001C228163|nr:lipase family protein [Nocardia noduli]
MPAESAPVAPNAVPLAVSTAARLPEDDEFYCPPDDFALLPAGTILRARSVELALFGRIPQRVTAWQLLYRTNGIDGVAEAAVTTVALPLGAEPGADRRLVAFQCAIDGVSSRCFPSYALRRGARALGAIPQLELPVIAEALARGWAVTVPDHGGMGGHFGVAREPGYRALDAIRAALDFAPLGLRPGTSVALWGYSGGGLATAWAAEVAAEYAPELDIVGAVAGSPVGDPAAAFIRLNGSLMSGFSTVCVAALRRAYPALDRALCEFGTAEFHTLLADAESRTTLALLARFAGKNMDRYSTTGFADILARPAVRRVLDDIRPGQCAPAMPLLVIQGVHDELIAVADVDGHVRRYREAGAHVRYLRDRLSLHLALLYLGVPATMNWVADRFDGLDLPPDRTETVWSIAWTTREIVGHLRFAALVARVLTGRPITARRGGPGIARSRSQPKWQT